MSWHHLPRCTPARPRRFALFAFFSGAAPEKTAKNAKRRPLINAKSLTTSPRGPILSLDDSGRVRLMVCVCVWAPSSAASFHQKCLLHVIISCGSSGGNPCTQALRAPPCTQAVLVVIFAWAREISANFTRTPAWLHGFPPLLPQTTISISA